MFGKRVRANMGEYVKAKSGEVKGVLVPFRGKKMIETSDGIIPQSPLLRTKNDKGTG